MLLNEDKKEKNKDPSLAQRKTLLENIFFLFCSWMKIVHFISCKVRKSVKNIFSKYYGMF